MSVKSLHAAENSRSGREKNWRDCRWYRIIIDNDQRFSSIEPMKSRLRAKGGGAPQGTENWRHKVWQIVIVVIRGRIGIMEDAASPPLITHYEEMRADFDLRIGR